MTASSMVEIMKEVPMKVIVAKRDGRRGALLAASLLVASLATGCSTTAGIEASGKIASNGNSAPPLVKEVAVNNVSLGWSVEVVDMKSVTLGNLIKAQVSLRSKDRDALPLQYRFDWFDAQGMEIASNTAWKPLIIYGKETKTVQAVAPDPLARGFKLKLREPDQD